jgi:chromatin structure-remodeling complex subunit RSC1/2
VNASIPSDIRERFQRDETGHVLFFTQPPLVREHPGVSWEHAQLGHSRRYLAGRARELKDAKLDRKAKRKERDEMLNETEKKRAAVGRETALAEKKNLDELALKMLYALTSDIMDEADRINAIYEGWNVKGEEIEN